MLRCVTYGYGVVCLWFVPYAAGGIASTSSFSASGAAAGRTREQRGTAVTPATSVELRRNRRSASGTAPGVAEARLDSRGDAKFYENTTVPDVEKLKKGEFALEELVLGGNGEAARCSGG